MIGIFALAAKAVGAFVVPGWASIVVGMSFLGGVQLIVIGMMGLYVARIYEEVRGRPLYILSDAEGFAIETPGERVRTPTAAQLPR